MGIVSPGLVDLHLTSQDVGRSLAINALTPVTLTVRINATWTGGARMSMVGTYNTPTTGGTAIQIGSSTGGGECSVWTWGGAVLVQTPLAFMVNGANNHVAYTFDGTNHSIYINGIFVASSTANPQLAGTITAIYINGFPGGGTAETAAFIFDDLCYFDRLLSPAEIQTIYQTKGAADGMAFGLVSRQLFSEEPPGAIANDCIDYSGGGNNLTPIGGATGVNFTYGGSFVSLDARAVTG